MATNLSSTLSVFNRNCDQDICILHCHHNACHTPPCQTIIARLTEKQRYSIIQRTLDEEYNLVSHLIQEGFRRSVCTIFLVCKHTVSLVTQCLQYLPNMDILRRCIAVGNSNFALNKTNLGKSEIAFFYLDYRLSLDSLKSEVARIIDENSSYDDFEVGGDYPDISGISSPERQEQDERYISNNTGLKMPHVTSSKGPDYNRCIQASVSKQTLKDIESYPNDAYTGLTKGEEDSDGDVYEPLSFGSDFLLLRTLSLSDEQNGVHVDSKCCIPQEYYDESVEELTYNINTGRPALVVEQIKHIHAHIIREAEKKKDIHTLVKLLWCDNNGIENRVVDVITDILLHELVNTQPYDILFHSVNTLLKIVQKRIASADNLLPVVLIMLSILFHQSLSHPDSEIIADKLKESHRDYQSIIKDFDDVEQCSVIHQDLTKSIKNILEDIGNKAGKPSCLKLENWTDALLDEKRVQKLEKELPKKMCFLEQYACVVRTLIQLNVRLNKKPLEFLMKIVKILVERYSTKPKYTEQLYPTFQLVAQGIVSILDKHEFEDRLPEDTVDTLDLFLLNEKVEVVRRAKVLDDIQKMLFHSNAQVARKVIKHIEEVDVTGQLSLVRRVLSHTQYLFSSLSFVTHTINTPTATSNIPVWHTIHGSILGHDDVTLHVLLPSRECILKGKMGNYKDKADKEDTRYHENTIEILRHLSSNRINQIIKLFACQLRPMPFMYAIERLQHYSLSTYLRRQRKKEEWLSVAKLVPMAADIIHAVEFIHQEGVIHRDLTACSFSCRKDGTIVLVDFGLAQIVDTQASKSKENFVSDVLGSKIPTRWTAPESLLEDRYDIFSDTWMVGHVLYELFTLGCHPYTELYGNSTQDIMEWVVFQELKLHRWPCIPLPIHEIILDCCKSTPEERIQLSIVPARLEAFLASDKSLKKRPSIKSVDRAKLRYPELDNRQQYEPERGLPTNINGLKKQPGDPRKSKRRPVVKLAVTESSLSSPDQPVYHAKHYDLEVTEPVTTQFMVETFPSFQNDVRNLLHIVGKWPPDRQTRETSQHGLTHNLQYRCRNGASFLDLAQTQRYGNTEDNELKYLEAVQAAIDFVHGMHTRNWILRDICCSTLYRAFTGEERVFMPRIGRLLHINNNDSPDGCVVDRECIDLFKNRRNWFPVEVLRPGHGQFSKESDIYMLAMTIYEFYKLTELGPMSSRLEAVPFAKVQPDKLLEELHSGEIPEEPDNCPHWLWTELQKCWNRDQTQRPSAAMLLKVFRQNGKYSSSALRDEIHVIRQEMANILTERGAEIHDIMEDEGDGQSNYQWESASVLSEDMYDIGEITKPEENEITPPPLPKRGPPSRRTTNPQGKGVHFNKSETYKNTAKTVSVQIHNSTKSDGNKIKLERKEVNISNSSMQDGRSSDDNIDTISLASTMSFANVSDAEHPDDGHKSTGPNVLLPFPEESGSSASVLNRNMSVSSVDSKLSFANASSEDYDYPYITPNLLPSVTAAKCASQNNSSNDNAAYLEFIDDKHGDQQVLVAEIGNSNNPMDETPVYQGIQEQENKVKNDKSSSNKKKPKKTNGKERHLSSENALYEGDGKPDRFPMKTEVRSKSQQADDEKFNPNKTSDDSNSKSGEVFV